MFGRSMALCFHAWILQGRRLRGWSAIRRSGRFDRFVCKGFRIREFREVFAGNQRLEGMDVHATCYGGHQFGNWAGQLGDGRAINLGEIVHQNNRFMLQLKGAGPTPYSRSADGLAVLRSSLREYLCSEAMYHLGVPTTRALSLITSGSDVVRDMLYDGHPAAEPGAVVCRVSPSFIRFGHFQILTARNELKLLRDLADFTISTQFEHLKGLEDKERFSSWFDEVCQKTAHMIVHWMRVGFVHGVMNTDNMSIIGETIDYGPMGGSMILIPNGLPIRQMLPIGATVTASNQQLPSGI